MGQPFQKLGGMEYYTIHLKNVPLSPCYSYEMAVMEVEI
jgi:hypothetical protein